MLLNTVHLDNDILLMDEMKENLSLWPFIDYLQKTIQEQTFGSQIPRLANELIMAKMEQFGDISEANLPEFKEVLEAMYHLAKGVPKAENVKWAIGYPFSDRVFFGTSGFYDLMAGQFNRIQSNPFIDYLDIQFTNKQLFLLILERFYNFPKLHNKIRYIKRNEDFNQYYELFVDFSFVQIETTQELPKLDLTSVKQKDEIDFKDIEPILSAFDLSKFVFTGISICSYVDCQQNYIAEELQGLINNLNIYQGVDGLTKLNEILGNIVAYRGVKSSFYPILKLNGIPVLSPDLAKNSMLITEDVFYDQEIMDGELNKFLEKPTVISFGMEDGFESENTKLKLSLQKIGLKSYICFPLLQHGNLVGIFELYSWEENILNRSMLSQIRTFYPLLSQLANDISFTFKSELNNIILHRYTSLQPAVEWRFNQVAAAYLGDLMHNQGEPQLEKIIFKEVYPFYAAVDVKDSSYLRNKSYRDDLLIRVNYVAELIDKAQDINEAVIDELFLNKFTEIRRWTHGSSLDHYLLDILAFFQDDVPKYLNQFEALHPDYASFLDICRKKLKYSYDDMNSSNETFERSLQKINRLVKSEMNTFNEKIQGIFPSYFETFRTDGIEYDLYVGQSISPRDPFKSSFLRLIRMEQIASIARIGQKTHLLKDSLSIPLETTQLIFIHPNPIDISFREDERRFDVEGSYNIRYQIIKKRIDKAMIANTTERLVKPGHIAIVYSRSLLVQELKDCLKEVAYLGLIESAFEELELENLQGVNDLMAIRVKIILEDKI